MKSLRNYLKNRKGVFGLTSVQTFFAIILAIALLAYVIVVIMGQLQSSSSTILSSSSLTFTVANETIGPVSEVGTNLAKNTLDGVACTITRITSDVDKKILTSPNYTVSNCRISAVGPGAEESGYNNTKWNVTYSGTYNSAYQTGTNTILANTSTGITGFFQSVNPVYSILAILVIILVLVVLVRVVTGGSMGGQKESSVPL